MKRIYRLSNSFMINCAKCGAQISNNEKTRRWRPNDGEKSIVGICFVTEDGDPIEGFDLCDKCIGKLYSKMIY